MTYSDDDSPLFSDKIESDLNHILMPNMAWACGGNIVTKGGHIKFLNKWDEVTCPECIAEGRDAISARTRRQQGQES
ncbi:hypothetical protein [Nocardioides sp. WS12]|uniref:hypothetical protein n=1 Tax=Nocardioides sp. WS12 TaxID=2486272 RepID=UPI0015FE48C8|nr:hypothetical protein [Nocardioides sp. WS12]